VIGHCNAIIAEYQGQGFSLTLRQLYYQMIARDLFPAAWTDPTLGTKNTEKNYKKLGTIVNDGRMAGLIDWNAIEDRTRNLKGLTHWNSPEEIIRAARASFRIDRWANQQYRPEVWVEKSALEAVVAIAANRWDVPYFSCRGYNSQSEQWRAGRRMKSWSSGRQTPVVLHLGDHDSSGVDMTRDNTERLGVFAERAVEVSRLALNMDQILTLNPPPSPAKESDPRTVKYIEVHGSDTWELDALDPNALVDIIDAAIQSFIDFDAWEDVEADEREQREILEKVEENWSSVVSFLEGRRNGRHD
jgi:hypothetical protein